MKSGKKKKNYNTNEWGKKRREDISLKFRLGKNIVNKANLGDEKRCIEYFIPILPALSR